MSYTLISVLIITALGIFFLNEGGLLAIIGTVVLSFCVALWIAIAFLSWDWVSAKYKAEIINKEYGTSYTRTQVYYASSVIETIRELDRKRIELNGNLINGEE